MNKDFFSMRSIVKQYQMGEEVQTILKGIDLDLNEGEFLSVLGPSGSGKTTLMNIIGCLDTPTAGTYILNGRMIRDLDQKQLAHIRSKEIGFIFQQFQLLPRLDAMKNVELPLIYAGVSPKERAQRAEEMLVRVGLKDKLHHHRNQLSGGQQQRVAIARALISHPKVLLLDEPLGALDLKLRKDMQNELKTIQQAIGITFIYVTHDQEEALSMSDTVVVMADGEIQQIGTPTDIYNEPKNAFVADFIGESNIIDGVMLEDGKARFSGHTFDCLDSGFEKREPVDIVIRPEDVDIVPVEKGMLEGVVTSVTFMGVHYEIIVDVKGFKWMIQTTDFVDVDEHIGIFLEPDAIHVMKKSKYSGMFGDYSSFSDELEQLSVGGNEEE